jgi:hypothetical protein
LKSIGFKGGYGDARLMTKRSNLGICYIALYVDNCYCAGHKAQIDDTIKKIIVSGFEVKVESSLADYLSCNVIFNKDKTKAWLGQPHLIKNLERKCSDAMTNLQKYRAY